MTANNEQDTPTDATTDMAADQADVANLAADRNAPRMNALLDRFAQIPEGAAMSGFMREKNIGCYLIPMEDGVGGYLPHHRAMVFNQDLPDDVVMCFLPHEIMHAQQMFECPDLRDCYGALVAEKPRMKNVGSWPVMRDFLWALNMGEMAAYAVQTDFVFRLAEAGDSVPLEIYSKNAAPLAHAYRAVSNSKNLCELTFAGRKCLSLPANEPVAPEFKRDYATAAAGYMWYWATLHSAGKMAHLHYNDHIVSAAHDNSKLRLAPVFNAAAGSTDIAPPRREWGRADIVRMGRGYPVNPLDVTGFDDVTMPAYRDRITRENSSKLRFIERALREQSLRAG